MFEIRKGLPDDAEKVIKYLKIIGSETDNLTFDGNGISLTIEQEREYLKSVSNSNNNLYIVAVEDDEIIGCASLSSSQVERLKHRGSIGVSVQKKAWGRHIGSMLMEELIGFAKKAGLEILMLEVRSDNDRAIGLYKKFGFKKLCTLEGYLKIKGILTDYDLMMLKL